MRKVPFTIEGSLTSRKGNPVSFTPPQYIMDKGGEVYQGKIIDEVWADEKINYSKPRKPKSKNDWGDYSFFAQQIEWEDGVRQIRLGYYQRPAGENYWRFASQTTLTTEWSIIKKLFVKTLKKVNWFKDI